MKIMDRIPHRYPFLLVDKIVEIEPFESATGVKCVTASEPHFQGHFPQRPIMPGVLIVEAIAQAASALVVKTLDLGKVEPLVYFMSMDKTKFRKLVEPGDSMELHVTVIKNRGKVWKFWGEAKVGDELAAEAEFSAMIIPPDKA